MYHQKDNKETSHVRKTAETDGAVDGVASHQRAEQEIGVRYTYDEFISMLEAEDCTVACAGNSTVGNGDITTLTFLTHPLGTY